MFTSSSYDAEDVILVVADIRFHELCLQAALDSNYILCQLFQSFALEVSMQVQLDQRLVRNTFAYLVEDLLECPQLDILTCVLLILPEWVDCDWFARQLLHAVE